MSANGRLKRSELTLVQSDPSQYLSVKTARAYKRARKALMKQYPASKKIAEPAGGYRDFFVQGDMHVHPAKYNINPKMSVTLAAAGESSHGLGTAFDLINAPLTPWVLNTLKQYGFTRTFGSADPNHFGHDGKTATGIIPTGRVYYVVESGDTLTKIANEYHTTVVKLVSLNKIQDASKITVGERIRVK